MKRNNVDPRKVLCFSDVGVSKRKIYSIQITCTLSLIFIHGEQNFI